MQHLNEVQSKSIKIKFIYVINSLFIDNKMPGIMDGASIVDVT